MGGLSGSAMHYRQKKALRVFDQTVTVMIDKKRILIGSLRLFLGGVFIWASIDKILHPLSFAVVIKDYQLLPLGMVNLVAVVLPWIELFLGLALILGLWLPGSILLANVLLAVFTLALLFNVARGLDIHCGCFRSDATGDPTTTWYLIRDGIFVAVAGILFWNVVREAR